MDLETLWQYIDKLWTFCLWYAGISTTTTVGLFGWIVYLQSKLQIIQDVGPTLTELLEKTKQIESALVGTLEKPGLMTRHHNLDKRVEKLEEKHGPTD